jgi:hypothetical protein
LVVRGDLLGDFEFAAVLQLGGDAGGAKGDVGGGRAPAVSAALLGVAR